MAPPFLDSKLLPNLRRSTGLRGRAQTPFPNRSFHRIMQWRIGESRITAGGPGPPEFCSDIDVVAARQVLLLGAGGSFSSGSPLGPACRAGATSRIGPLHHRTMAVLVTPRGNGEHGVVAALASSHHAIGGAIARRAPQKERSKG
jgi:hypothetical protein